MGLTEGRRDPLHLLPTTTPARELVAPTVEGVGIPRLAPAAVPVTRPQRSFRSVTGPDAPRWKVTKTVDEENAAGVEAATVVEAGAGVGTATALPDVVTTRVTSNAEEAPGEAGTRIRPMEGTAVIAEELRTPALIVGPHVVRKTRCPPRRGKHRR